MSRFTPPIPAKITAPKKSNAPAYKAPSFQNQTVEKSIVALPASTLYQFAKKR